ncbi:hypothetical protein IW262DRAFT_1495910 [Armillaria fumosa]|nr:hypothetical protein IW262DRAFT_1495910 [Armillaria fumosa]
MRIPRALKKYPTTMTKSQDHISLPSERWHSRSVQSRFLWFVQVSLTYSRVPTTLLGFEYMDRHLASKFFITWILQSEFHSRRASFGQIIVEYVAGCGIYVRGSLGFEYMKWCPVSKNDHYFLRSKPCEANPTPRRYISHLDRCADGYTISSPMGPLIYFDAESCQGSTGLILSEEFQRPSPGESTACSKKKMTAPPTSLVLEHAGFGPSNILVDPGDPTKIVGILGWAGARVVPFWGLDFLELDEREWAGCGLSFRNVVMRRFSDGIWYDEDLLTAAWYARKWHVLTDMSGALPFRRS